VTVKRVGSKVVALALVAAAGCGASSRSKPGPAAGDPAGAIPLTMVLTSAAFVDGGSIPLRYSCEGDNVPPPLSWQGTPTGTAELAVEVVDPDAPQGPFYHWVLLGLPATLTQLADGGPPPAGTRQATAGSGRAEYVGMCPPNGQQHHYRFTVYALRHQDSLPNGVGAAAAVAAVRNDAVGRGTLVGLFRR
jgi:Raf kinase inhibitor-like YbhB/YbcL family protein